MGIDDYAHWAFSEPNSDDARKCLATLFPTPTTPGTAADLLKFFGVPDAHLRRSAFSRLRHDVIRRLGSPCARVGDVYVLHSDGIKRLIRLNGEVHVEGDDWFTPLKDWPAFWMAIPKGYWNPRMYGDFMPTPSGNWPPSFDDPSESHFFAYGEIHYGNLSSGRFLYVGPHSWFDTEETAGSSDLSLRLRFCEKYDRLVSATEVALEQTGWWEMNEGLSAAWEDEDE